MPIDHPFQSLFETFGKLPDSHSDAVNQDAREELKSWLDVGLEKPGHCILLKAPRAGHGKTHLLTRLQHELGGTHEFIPLQATGGSRIDAMTALDDTLRRLIRGLPAAGGLTVLDLVARRLFSSSLQPLVNSGEVPCQDREGALNALRTRPIETFDFHHPSAVTAHWARENFELLGPRLSLELSQKNGLALREVSFWVDAMFRFAATPIDNPGRSRALAVTVFSDPGSEAAAHERLIALLGLMTGLMRVVLVADEMEGFSSDETAALRFASFLGAIRQSVTRLDVILSVNQDVWDSAFVPRLSGGLADRLSEVVVELEPLDSKAMLAILESRAEGTGEQILGKMDSDFIPSHARGLIKYAGEKWVEAEQEKSRKTGEAFPEFSSAPVLATPLVSLGSDAEIFAVEPNPEPVFSQNEPVYVTSAEEVTMSNFFPEAAIAAFKRASELDNEPEPGAGSAVEVTPAPPVVEEIFQASSWPSPEISGSRFSTAFSSEEPTLPKPPPSQPAENPFQAAAQPSFASAPPVDASFFPTAPPVQPEPQPQPVAESFQAPPQQYQQEQVPVFQSAPEVIPQTFQAAPEPEKTFQAASEEKDSGSPTDRVDDLLRQFRERYGKN